MQIGLRDWAFIAIVVFVAASCSGAPEKPDPQPVVQQPAGESKCEGNRVPPQGGYRQETAFVPTDTPNAPEVAKSKAVGQLRDKICQGYRCGELESKIVLWNTERDASQVCAMAVVKAKDIANFEEAPRVELKANLERAAAELVKLTGKDAPIIAVDNVRDVGVDGGPRAEWLIDRMGAALSKHGGAMAKIPAEWPGLNPPRGADAVLRGRVTRMHGRESMLEITWMLDLGKKVLSVDPVMFPEFVGPRVDASTELPELPGASEEVSLRFDARPGGGLCNGQMFEMHLEVARPMHVRVIDLYNTNEGLVIWQSNGRVKAGENTSLGQFQAIAGEVPAERFLVLAAADVKDLEAYGATKPPCRVPTDAVSGLLNGSKIPARSVATSRGYRVLNGPECSGFNAPASSVDALKSLPACF